MTLSNSPTDKLINEHTIRLCNWVQGDYENHRMGTARYTQELYPYKALFSPVKCGRLTLKNRIVAAPPGSFQTLSNDKQLGFIRAAARGGAGLVCTGFISAFGGEDALRTLRSIADTVHACSSRVFIQLAPGNKRAKLPYISKAPITSPELQLIILQSIRAVSVSRLCGFDGLCLNLADSCLNGSASVELVSQLRHFAGADFPIMCRVDIENSLNESLAYLSDLVRAGADMFSIGFGGRSSEWLKQPPYAMPAGCYLDLIKPVKDYFISSGLKSHIGADIPIAASGKLGYPDIAENALREGFCDMLMLSRSMLADPEWCKKAYAGRVDEIRPCICCNQGCTDRLCPSCSVNVRAGIDAAPLVKAENAKRIAVVGGGSAGMSFAIYAAACGHKVELFEKDSRLGGRLLSASRSVSKYDSFNYRHWLIVQLSRSENIQINLNTFADAKLLSSGRYDAVVYANGAAECQAPHISGWGDIPYVFASEIMAKPEKLPPLDSKRVAVLGSGSTAIDCAWWLKTEMGAGKVTVVDEKALEAEDFSVSMRSWISRQFKDRKIELMSLAKPLRILENRLFLQQNCSYSTQNKPSRDTFIRNLDCDLIVLAGKKQADMQQFFDGQSEFTAPEVYSIGDSFEAGNILKSNRAAHELALDISGKYY